MKRIEIAIALMAVSVAAGAQNVNPTVQVTNDYRTRMSEVKKQGVQLAVPDSLYDFDYDFDYSVFESPYKGAYEFSPYLVKTNPEKNGFNPQKMYLRAGAGYTLHPELAFVYAPVTKEKFTLNVFADGGGFWGPYSNLGDDLKPASGTFTDHDFSDRAGIGGRAAYRGGDLSFELGHEGVFASSTAYNSGFANVGLKSVDSGEKFFYDAGLKFRFGSDALPEGHHMGETNFQLFGSFGPVVNERYKILFDGIVEFDSLEGAGVENDPSSASIFTLFEIKPHVKFSLGPVDIDAGVKIDHSNAFHFAPDVLAEFALGGRRQVTIYAGATGGDEFNSYHSFKMANHRFTPDYGSCGYSRVPIKGFAGLRGYVSNHLQFDLGGGYGKWLNSPLEGVALLDRTRAEASEINLPGTEMMGYADYRMAFVNAKLSWHSERFDALGEVAYRKMDISAGDEGSCLGLYSIPAFVGSVRLKYNAGHRLFFGVDASGQSKRVEIAGGGPDVPGFVDLGVNAEYRFSPKFGFWAKGGNLLCQPVRKSLLYVEKSPYATVGITLSL